MNIGLENEVEVMRKNKQVNIAITEVQYNA